MDPAESSPDRFCRVPPISAAGGLGPVGVDFMAFAIDDGRTSDIPCLILAAAPFEQTHVNIQLVLTRLRGVPGRYTPQCPDLLELLELLGHTSKAPSGIECRVEYCWLFYGWCNS